MLRFRVSDVLKDKILISRESARELENPLRAILVQAQPTGNDDETTVTVDFEGVEGIAPSFLDELVTILESLLGSVGKGRGRRLVVANPPTRLSAKFEAVARGHGMSVQALSNGSWSLQDAPEEPHS
jgi:hypothetical protein